MQPETREQAREGPPCATEPAPQCFLQGPFHGPLLPQGKKLPATISEDAEEGEVSDEDSADEMDEECKLFNGDVSGVGSGVRKGDNRREGGAQGRVLATRLLEAPTHRTRTLVPSSCADAPMQLAVHVLVA